MLSSAETRVIRKAIMRNYSLINILLPIIVVFACNKRIEHLQFYQSNEKVIEFKYSADNEPYLTALRERCQLDSLVKEAESDIEKVRIICNWVNNLWDHDGLNSPTSNDPISIIEESKAGKSFRCVEYSTVIQGCLTALSIPARVVVLMTKDVETVEKWGSHYVVEAYIQGFEKWCFIDGQRNAIPILCDTPLNSVEFQSALANRNKRLKVYNLSDLSTPPYFRWITPSLYFFQYSVDNRVGIENRLEDKIMLVPIGAKAPIIFQKKWEIKNTEYSNSLLNIYSKPIIESQ